MYDDLQNTIYPDIQIDLQNTVAIFYSSITIKVQVVFLYLLSKLDIPQAASYMYA